jgi:NAD(P)H-dependent FMN reductase
VGRETRDARSWVRSDAETQPFASAISVAFLRSVAMSAIRLKTVVFLGSARNITPPWGGCARLGDRVLKHTLAVLADASRGAKVGEEAIEHEIVTFDPLKVFGEGGALVDSGAEVQKPTFFYGKDPPLPDAAAAMRDAIKAADCFLIVTPEYNHAAPPALLGMLNNFGGSVFGYKPLGMVCYSAGPWGGMRAAMVCRPTSPCLYAGNTGTPRASFAVTWIMISPRSCTHMAMTTSCCERFWRFALLLSAVAAPYRR